MVECDEGSILVMRGATSVCREVSERGVSIGLLEGYYLNCTVVSLDCACCQSRAYRHNFVSKLAKTSTLAV